MTTDTNSGLMQYQSKDKKNKKPGRNPGFSSFNQNNYPNLYIIK